MSASGRLVKWLIGGLVCLAGAFILYVGAGGSVWISPVEVVQQLVRGDRGEPASNVILHKIRVPRACAAGLIGLILGGVGYAFQALFRNPLAEPYVLGVASGAALGGTLSIAFGFSAALGGMGLPLTAIALALATLGFVMSLATRKGRLDVRVLLLAGVVTAAMLSGLLTFALLMSGEDTNRVLRWLLGSTTPMFWGRVGLLAAFALPGLLILWLCSRALDAYAIGEDVAASVGVKNDRLKYTVLGVGSLMTAVAVGVAGIIGFVGLVAPHIARRLVGARAVIGLPLAAMTGGVLLMFADIVAQRAKPGLEIPVGAVTALLGAPALLWLLRGVGRRSL